MTRTGFYFLAIGTGIVATPLHSCIKKFGEASEETLTRWLTELPLVEWFKLQYAVWFAIMLITFGFVI